jgi:hypothetical protein
VAAESFTTSGFFVSILGHCIFCLPRSRKKERGRQKCYHALSFYLSLIIAKVGGIDKQGQQP